MRVEDAKWKKILVISKIGFSKPLSFLTTAKCNSGIEIAIVHESRIYWKSQIARYADPKK